MTEQLIAKVVTKNKFWIVEQNGQKVATIQATSSGVTFVQNEHRESFMNIASLTVKHNIRFAKDTPAPHHKKGEISYDINGYPCDNKPVNPVFDVQRKLPIYTKTSKSKCHFCAGHYLIKFNSGFVHSYCPKLLTLSRYEYHGPFITKQQAESAMAHIVTKS
jgi:hypothetical protein